MGKAAPVVPLNKSTGHTRTELSQCRTDVQTQPVQLPFTDTARRRGRSWC